MVLDILQEAIGTRADTEKDAIITLVVTKPSGVDYGRSAEIDEPDNTNSPHTASEPERRLTPVQFDRENMGGHEGAKVSVIIPVYNVEPYVHECLKSVVSQTHTNIEVIVVNDGSTDDTPKIVSSLKAEHDCIVDIHIPNQGVSVALNHGLEAATGDYVLLVGGDDWIDKDTIERCLEALNEQEADIVMFNGAAFSDGLPQSEVERFGYTRAPKHAKEVQTGRDIFSTFIEEVNYIVSPCLYMYRYGSLGHIRFHPGLMYEDNIFTTRLLIDVEGTKVSCLPDRFFHRRVRPNSIMTQRKTKSHVASWFGVSDELLRHPLAGGQTPVSRALGVFIQSMLTTAVITAREASFSPFVIRSRMMALSRLRKLDRSERGLRVSLRCAFPELGSLANRIKRLRGRP